MFKFAKYFLTFTLLMMLAFGSMVPSYAQGPAIVMDDFGCGVLGADANGNYFFIPTTDSHVVFSNDANGNSILTCEVKHHPSSNPPKAVEFNYENTGFTCSTSFGSTKAWKCTVTPSGNSKLVCKITPNSPQ